MESFFETVKSRKSVRTYDGRMLSEEHRKAIEDYIKDIPNPFGIPVEFKLLDAKEHGLSSPVLGGEQLYVAGKVSKKAYAEAAFGYSFEKLVLYAQSLGIATVWIGGTMKREKFEEAAGLKEGELMPCVSPLGYPAQKRSLKEMMMRKGVGADSRIPADKLFFRNSWGNPLLPEGDMAELFETVRWAPSAVNKQPWRIIFKDGIYHFYEKKDKGFIREATGDLQKTDVGIALCHFITGAEAMGWQAVVKVDEPGLETPDDTEYVASVRISGRKSETAAFAAEIRKEYEK
ncbi:MAG: nitroreductase family protein [Lachnospiraceae bacterium]|nr:nitroreductase family protein [Lachnospiraceae bacterium]